MANALDVTTWRMDDEHGYFPVGAREKKMLWSTAASTHSSIKPNWPYLFKLSRKSYPEQFWAEVFAYRLGLLLDIYVPKAIPAFRMNDDGDTEFGALIEWFYDPRLEKFMPAGDFLIKIDKQFDQKKGKRHCQQYIESLCRVFNTKLRLQTDWKNWFYELILFDALIGNTDRHQENWGFIFKFDDQGITSLLSPLFDNGTSLGHERCMTKVFDWCYSDFQKYIWRGAHHIRLKPDEDIPRIGHFELIQKEIEKHPPLKKWICYKLKLITPDKLDVLISDLTNTNDPMHLSKKRGDWIKKLIINKVEAIEAIIMNTVVQYFFEPTKLFVTWQPQNGGSRYVVAFIEKKGEEVTLKYNVDSEDMEKAIANGFQGHPSFKFSGENETFSNGVVNAFTRRLPPRKRSDFGGYLMSHRLPATFNGSELALLAYTGAKLPSDSFSIIPDLSTVSIPFDYVLEVAGTRYQKDIDLEKVSIGDPVELVNEHSNEIDSNAIALYCSGMRIGYINKALCNSIHDLQQTKAIAAVVAKKNGTPERPLIYVMLMVR